MLPKIVTRLANIAAKMAESDKYDPTIEPVTAFEYYLDKAADKMLSIRGLPMRPITRKNLVLMSTPDGEFWEEPRADKAFTLCHPFPLKTPQRISMTNEQVQLYKDLFDCLSNNVPFNLYYSKIIDGVVSLSKEQMIIKEFDVNSKSITAENAIIVTPLHESPYIQHLYFDLYEDIDREGHRVYFIYSCLKEFSLTERQGG